MFEPTTSSIVSMVGTLWTINFCIFFVLTQKLRPKIQITRPEKKTEVRISLSISTRFVLYPFTLSTKCLYRDKKLRDSAHYTENIFSQLAVIIRR